MVVASAAWLLLQLVLAQSVLLQLAVLVPLLCCKLGPTHAAAAAAAGATAAAFFPFAAAPFAGKEFLPFSTAAATAGAAATAAAAAAKSAALPVSAAKSDCWDSFCGFHVVRARHTSVPQPPFLSRCRNCCVMPLPLAQSVRGMPKHSIWSPAVHSALKSISTCSSSSSSSRRRHIHIMSFGALRRMGMQDICRDHLFLLRALHRTCPALHAAAGRHARAV
ncbi:hypothetical protein COO60DRAFT_653566 [Scenedesmus sp. NREL 46B-D3]|nr:hypothetical protein COO60DRAFT_653566 [Scenedesmus sp. NREL 46B-D3]